MLSGTKSAVICTISLFLLTAVGMPAHAAADPAAGMNAPLYQRVNPSTKANLVTPWEDEAAGAAAYNFTTDLGTPFTAATTATDGLSAVHRLFKAGADDFTWAVEGSKQLSDATSKGYADQGTDFYAAATQLAGTVPVNSYVSGAVHRLWLGSDGATLTTKGWALEAPAFFVPGAAAAPPPPPPLSPPTSAGVGAAPLGQAVYPAPSSAIYVSTTGSDSASGSVSTPVRTVGHAVDIAPSGGTVVMRAGAYHESVVIAGKPVTLQNYPGEAAWLDGSEAVGGWIRDGATWRRDGWTTRFDHSPTFVRGASDLTEEGWQFINPSYPMAAHPDQVFVDGAALQQVSSRSLVKPGTFFLDEAGSQLFIGSDPTGHAVTASTVVKGLSVQAPGSVVRGIGIRRYAPSIPDIGAITVEAARVRLENVEVSDSATIGVGVVAADCVLDHVTVQGSGLLGIHGQYADRLVLSSVLSTLNNDEHFNVAPVSGGAKLGTTRGVTVTGSSFSGNFGWGFWEDESVYDTVLRGSSFSDNTAAGVFLEISAKAVVVDNVIARNHGEGIKINNTSDVRIWNNTLVGNVGRPIDLPQDTRRNTDPHNPAADPRRPFPDPTMPWTLGPVTVRNNIVAQGAGTANCLLCVEDYSYEKSAEEMGVTSNGNVYQRPSASSPSWLVVWSTGGQDPSVFDSLAEFTAQTGQDARSREFVGDQAVASDGTLTDRVTKAVTAIAEPLPADIATIAGKPAGTQHVGAW